MKKSELYQSLLSQANEAAKGYAQFAGDVAAVELRRVTAKYAQLLAKAVIKLEADSRGRIIASKLNNQILSAIGEMSDAYVKRCGIVGSTASLVGQAMAQAIKGSMKAMGIVLEKEVIDDALIGAFERSGVIASITVKRGAMIVGTSLSDKVQNLISDSILKFEGNKSNLISALFSSKGIEHFLDRNQRMEYWARDMEKSAMGYIDRLKSGELDIAYIRDRYREDVAGYLEARKKYLQDNGLRSTMLDDTALETQTITVVKREIMEGYQDSIYRASAEALPKDTKWLNAKNTAFEDNCVDAMNAPAMTLDQWRSSPYGLPRSEKRDCGVYCECLLFPDTVGVDSEIGADVSAPEAKITR